MVTCNECGYENHGRRICKRCGAPLDLSAEKNGISVDDLPDISLYEVNRELKKLIRYFDFMRAQYSEYEFCNQKLDLLDKKGYVPIGVLVFGIIMMGVTTWLSVLVALRAFKLYNGLILWLAMFFVDGLYAAVAYSRSLKDNRKKIKKYLGREVELAKQLTNYYNDYGPCLLEAKYTDPRILDRLQNIIKSGRASSLEQALDLLFEDSGRTKEESAEYLATVASRQAEFGEKDALVFCSSSFFGAYHKVGEKIRSVA
ncbi:MAG: hypothetical protein SPL61_08110 [Saccharofermentans sp.]|nr:hypothetical protein [Saccharofermentans sp.]